MEKIFQLQNFCIRAPTTVMGLKIKMNLKMCQESSPIWLDNRLKAILTTKLNTLQHIPGFIFISKHLILESALIR